MTPVSFNTNKANTAPNNIKRQNNNQNQKKKLNKKAIIAASVVVGAAALYAGRNTKPVQTITTTLKKNVLDPIKNKFSELFGNNKTSKTNTESIKRNQNIQDAKKVSRKADTLNQSELQQDDSITKQPQDTATKQKTLNPEEKITENPQPIDDSSSIQSTNGAQNDGQSVIEAANEQVSDADEILPIETIKPADAALQKPESAIKQTSAADNMALSKHPDDKAMQNEAKTEQLAEGESIEAQGEGTISIEDVMKQLADRKNSKAPVDDIPYQKNDTGLMAQEKETINKKIQEQTHNETGNEAVSQELQEMPDNKSADLDVLKEFEEISGQKNDSSAIEEVIESQQTETAAAVIDEADTFPKADITQQTEKSADEFNYTLGAIKRRSKQKRQPPKIEFTETEQLRPKIVVEHQPTEPVKTNEEPKNLFRIGNKVIDGLKFDESKRVLGTDGKPLTDSVIVMANGINGTPYPLPGGAVGIINKQYGKTELRYENGILSKARHYAHFNDKIPQFTKLYEDGHISKVNEDYVQIGNRLTPNTITLYKKAPKGSVINTKITNNADGTKTLEQYEAVFDNNNNLVAKPHVKNTTIYRDEVKTVKWMSPSNNTPAIEEVVQVELWDAAGNLITKGVDKDNKPIPVTKPAVQFSVHSKFAPEGSTPKNVQQVRTILKDGAIITLMSKNERPLLELRVDGNRKAREMKLIPHGYGSRAGFVKIKDGKVSIPGSKGSIYTVNKKGFEDLTPALKHKKALQDIKDSKLLQMEPSEEFFETLPDTVLLSKNDLATKLGVFNDKDGMLRAIAAYEDNAKRPSCVFLFDKGILTKSIVYDDYGKNPLYSQYFNTSVYDFYGKILADAQ